MVDAPLDARPGWNPDVWKQLAEIGILGLGFDESSVRSRFWW